jgi:hypothetical protein
VEVVWRERVERERVRERAGLGLGFFNKNKNLKNLNRDLLVIRNGATSENGELPLTIEQ